MVETVVNKRRMYSTLTKKSVEGKYAKGRIGSKHELCSPGQRQRCVIAGRCEGFDPNALSICEKTLVPVKRKDR